MRVGHNSSKEEKIIMSHSFHRVVIPLYIPNENEYYKDSYKIFEYCLFSIIKTSITILKVSVISNNSCKSVNQRLLSLQEDGYIDELIIETEPIGKVNSILKVLRRAEESLITITDADVLFCNGWEAAVLDVFKAFSKAGAVCPVPVFRRHNNFTYNIWFDYLFSNKLRFTPVVNKEAMTRFANSIGWPWLDEKYKDVMLTLESKDGLKAMVGCSHFVATYKREVFEALPNENSEYKLGGNSEEEYLDKPVIYSDGYRLSTEDNYAFHMGNVLEDWHVEVFESLYNEEKIQFTEELHFLKSNKIKYYLKNKITAKIFDNTSFRRWFYKSKGLNKQQLENYMTK